MPFFRSGFDLDLEKRFTVHADQLRFDATFIRDHRHIQTFASSARNRNREAVSLLLFEGEVREAVPEVMGLELKASKAIAADVVEAALRLATVYQIRRPAAGTVESEG